MLDAADVAFLEGGCALIVGTVTPDGAPFVTRAWGLTIHVDEDPLTARLVLAAEDARAIELLAAGGRVAYTGTDVPTLHSLQLKGRGVRVDPATDEDRARAGRYADAFFADVMRVDRHPEGALVRLLPIDYVAATVTVEEVFNQTPGPSAGTRVGVP